MSTVLDFQVFARDNASSTFDKLGRSVDQSSNKFAKLQKVSAVAGKALALGLAVAGVAAVKMANSAAQDEQAQVKLATALHNAAGATKTQVAAVESWITAQGKALGVADDDLRPALSRLAVATGDVGKAQRLASLAMNVSAGTGKSLKTVTEALAKAQNGNLGGLSRLGVATKNAAGETKSLSAITKDLAATYSGSAAAAADTAAGKQKILQVQMSELGEAIGARLIPVLLRASEVGLKMVDWISRNQTIAAVLVGTLVGLTTVVWAVGAATKAWAAAQVVASAATKAWAAGQWLLNAALTANPIGLIVVGIAALVAGLVLAYKKSATFRSIVQAVGKAGQAAIGWIIDKVGALVSIVAGPATKVFSAYRAYVATVFKVIGTVIGTAIGVVSRLVAMVRGPATAAWQAYRGVVANVVSAVRSALDNVIDKVGAVVSAVKGGFTSAWNSARNAAVSAINAIRAPIDAVIGAVQRLIGALSNIHVPHISLPHLPGLASGGTVTRPGMVRVGERGPETLMLPQGASVIPLGGSSSTAAHGGGVVIHSLTINATDKPSPRALMDALHDASVIYGL